jgi:hypothetical protein
MVRLFSSTIVSGRTGGIPVRGRNPAAGTAHPQPERSGLTRFANCARRDDLKWQLRPPFLYMRRSRLDAVPAMSRWIRGWGS